MEVITDNYREHPAISNSDLKLLKKRPRLFYDVKYGDAETEDKKAFHLGDLLDTYCLNPGKLETDYILCDVEAPSSAYHKAYVENRLAGMSPVEAYSAKYSTKNKSEDKIAEEAADLEKQYKDYIEFDDKAKGKIEYSEDDEYKANQMKMSIMGHKAASKMILADSGKPHEHFYSHLALKFKLGDIEAKGELDRLIIDEKEKTIKVIDLKTTGKPIYAFNWQAKKYDYPRQLLIYGEAAVQFAEEKGFLEDLDEWSVKYYLVAVEKSEPFECRVFSMPNIAMQEALEELNELLNQYKWHKKNEAWDHRPEYYKNDGIETMEYTPDTSNLLNQLMGRGRGRGKPVQKES